MLSILTDISSSAENKPGVREKCKPFGVALRDWKGNQHCECFLHFMHSDGCSAGIRNSRWDPIIRQTRTPPPGFHSSSVYHMDLSSWAPLTDNERRQPVQLQAKHSAFYRPKHVSGKLTMSIQFFPAFNTHHNASATVPWPLHTTVLLKTLAWDDKNSRNITGSKWGKLNLQRLWHEKFILTCTFFSFFKKKKKVAVSHIQQKWMGPIYNR